MEIGLVDVDCKNFPNIALMKLSAFHKERGDSVEWAVGYVPYDRVYMAKVFTFTPDDMTSYQGEIVQGGTGYNLTSRLPDEVERCYPDYGLYGITDTAYGYLSRGCPRGCSFCIVGDKEGKASRKVADLRDWWNGQKKIVLLDPNITACKDWQDLFGQLADSKAEIDYTQGLDIRLMTDEKVRAINRTKYRKLHFAWDDPKDKVTPQKMIEYADAWNIHPNKRMVYILTNFNSTHEEDVYRVEKVRELGYEPYVMIYEKWNAPKLTRQLQRYANNKFIFHKLKSFKEYVST